MNVEIRPTGASFDIVDDRGRVVRRTQSRGTAERLLEQFRAMPDPTDDDAPATTDVGEYTVKASGRGFGVYRGHKRVRFVSTESTALRIAAALAALLEPTPEPSPPPIPAPEPEGQPLHELLLTRAQLSTLKRAGITEVAQVEGLSGEELEAINGIGPAVARAVLGALAARG